jgi:hypothetical protein
MTSASGFTAQTWDIAGNEANFFVRDVTGGSRLPLRIRPGAPTSSVDIAATGNVGIGIASPQRRLHVHSAANTVLLITDTTSGSNSTDGLQLIQSGLNSFVENQEAGSLTLRTSATDRVTVPNNALGLKSAGEHVGFGAQAVQKIIPEAVTQNARGYMLINNDPILWTMLNAIKEQQKEIEQLKGQIKQLRASSRKRK